MPSLALQGLLADLTRDFHSEHHGQTVDVVQYCADWFQHKLKRERAATQSSTISRAGPGASMGSARKFPNFPTMSLPQTPGNIFQSAISQPSPFSEHAPSDSPFGNGMLSQRRATLANTDASVLNSNLSNATNPFGSSSNFTSSQAGPFGSTTNQQLPQLMEEGSPDEDTAMETSSPPAGDAPNSFANFSFNDGNGPSPFNEPSPFQANKLPPQAISSGSAQASADELRPPSYALGRRTSVSAESLVPNHATFGASSQSENVTDPGNTEPKPNVPKSDSQLLRIRQAIGQNFLFRNLDEEQEKDVLAAMREVQVKQGEVVIEQGATGDFFYVVEAGDFDIFKRDDRTDQQTDPAPTEQTRGKKVHTAGPGGSFGELALMYNAPRAASVIAKGDGTLWALDRISFRTILLDHTSRKRRMYETFLLSVPILASLEGYERAKIADALESRTYQSGELVIQEGESGDDFYIIESGSALVEKSDAGVIGELKRGDYFGELALLNRAPRAATVKAGGQSGEKLRVAALGEKAFTRLLGPVREIMARKAGEMYGTAGAYRS